MQEKRQIFKKIIDYVVIRKLGITSYYIFGDELEQVLVLKNLGASFPIGTNEEASFRVVTTFDELTKKLRSLELPLEISSIQGASGVFRYVQQYTNTIKCEHLYITEI